MNRHRSLGAKSEVFSHDGAQRATNGSELSSLKARLEPESIAEDKNTQYELILLATRNVI